MDNPDYEKIRQAAYNLGEVVAEEFKKESLSAKLSPQKTFNILKPGLMKAIQDSFNENIR